MLQTRLKETEDPKNLVSMNVDDFMAQIHERVKNQSRFTKICNSIRFNTYDFVWYVYRVFNPCHKKIRAVIPRGWLDQVELIREINFAFIKEYVEDEMQTTCWDEGEYKDVHTFLTESYQYITIDRSKLEKDLYDELVKAQNDITLKHLPYNEKYSMHNKIETTIDERDMNILVKLMQYRKYMWS